MSIANIYIYKYLLEDQTISIIICITGLNITACRSIHFRTIKIALKIIFRSDLISLYIHRLSLKPWMP